jgi:uncharacterized protein (DUF433 family)
MATAVLVKDRTMNNGATNPTVVRTNRGLTVEGTRLTLYSIMDYIKEDWPPKLIRDFFDLTDQQINDVMAYIEAHREEVEAEYELVLRQAEERRRYWTEYNREHLAKARAMPKPPEQAEIWKKLRARQAELEQDEDDDDIS